MSEDFDLKSLKSETDHNNRYERRMAVLIKRGQDVARIASVVDSALDNIQANRNSFVIYGEPQSGKTEMMIALTAKLLDSGFQIVIILLNDSVQLLGQNLERFQRSGISPSPKKFNEVLPNDIIIGDHKWIIFAKKNAQDLDKLCRKLARHERKAILDDEADYATPNSQVNANRQSRINQLTGKLIGRQGVYIGVTATPARLDLNRTHDNLNEHWIDLRPHESYTGQDVFFPATFELSKLPYMLNLLPDTGDEPKHLRNALFSFMVNVAYLNTEINGGEICYSFLIHTSGKKDDHSVDYKRIVKTFEALREETNSAHEPSYRAIWDLARRRFPGHEKPIVRYILENCVRNSIVVMNSDKEKNVVDNQLATSPSTPFTIVIGGNIVSRGVTFNNLLSMYFTRDVKHKLQQDTYVQRARMFGSRNGYVKYFELSIPRGLFLDWQRCFIFHRLSLESRQKGNVSPVWLEGTRIATTAASSIAKSHVLIDKGEMSFGLFPFREEEIMQIVEADELPLDRLKRLSQLVGPECLPPYLVQFVENFMENGDDSIAIHRPASIMNYRDANPDVIARPKGLMGQSQLTKFPEAIHHFMIFTNDSKMARVLYKFEGNIRFLKTNRR